MITDRDSGGRTGLLLVWPGSRSSPMLEAPLPTQPKAELTSLTE